MTTLETNERLLEAIRSSAYADELDTNEPEATEQGIRVGKVEALPGLDKPVLRDAVTKRKLPGSGQYPRKSVVVEAEVVVSQPDSYRSTSEYRSAFEKLFPAGGDVNDRGSLAYAFDQFWLACEGSPQMIDCPHPEYHTEREHRGEPSKHVVGFKKDAAALFKMIELGVGKAAQNITVNSHEDKLVRILEQRQVDVRVQGLGFEEVAGRVALIESFGYSLLTEGDDGEPDPDLGAATEAGADSGGSAGTDAESTR